MAKFPTYEEMAKNVAEKALDEFLYDGKSIREWMQIIASEDCINRTDAINVMSNAIKRIFPEHRDIAEKTMNKLPSVTSHESKTVLYSGDGYADGYMVYDFGRCPACGWQFEEGDKDWQEPYCCHCGQRLDWCLGEVDKAESEEKA